MKENIKTSKDEIRDVLFNSSIRKTDTTNIVNNNEYSFSLSNNPNSNNEVQNFLNNNNSKGFESINEIIDYGGYNLKTWKTFFFSSLLMFIGGFYITYFNYIIYPFKIYYNLNDGDVQLISALSFLGLGIGNLLVGFLSTIYPRKNIIIFSLILSFFFHLGLSLIKHVIIFTFCRFMTSMFMGIYIVLILNILTEFLPVKFRAFFLNLVWIPYGLGGIFFLLVCKSFIPDLEYDKAKNEFYQNFHLAILQLAPFLLISVVLFIFFLEDSPRNLILTGETERAKEILEYYINEKLPDADMNKIIKNLKIQGANKNFSRTDGIIGLFKKRVSLISGLMVLTYFLISIDLYGIPPTIPIILKKISKEIQFNLDGIEEIKFNILENLTFNASLSLIGNFIGAIFTEIKFFGRKNSEIFLLSLGALFSLLGAIISSQFSKLIAISNGFLTGAMSVHMTYSGEIYPTQIRDLALGFFSAITRIGGFFSQFIFISLNKAGLMVPIYFYFVIFVCIILTVIYLPHDNILELDADIIDYDSSGKEELESEDDNEKLKENDNDMKKRRIF